MAADARWSEAAISAFHSGECVFKAFGGGGFVGLAGGFVEAELDDGDVGVRRG